MLAGRPRASPASGARPRESYFQRSYIDMGRDCGLSVFRLRQVEKTALDKLRGFPGPTDRRRDVREHGMAIEDIDAKQPEPRPRTGASPSRGRLDPAGRLTGFDASTARRFLEVLNAPRAGCIELRVLRAAFDRQGRVCRGDDSERRLRGQHARRLVRRRRATDQRGPPAARRLGLRHL